MHLRFVKYHGTGNDFIIIDNQARAKFKFSEKAIRFLCDRQTGIGADGLILAEQSENDTPYMKFFNRDGKEGSMCGNGGRCFASFLYETRKPEKMDIVFEAIDGRHEAKIISVDDNIIQVRLKMNDVVAISKYKGKLFMDSGSPHLVAFSKNLQDKDILPEAIKDRYNFSEAGTNVNFVEPTSAGLLVRTYERGVEAETLSCGTGAVASAIASFEKGIINQSPAIIITRGGKLTVFFEKHAAVYTHIWLEGPATQVFTGSIWMPYDIS